jgi:hypothetical protein
VRDADGWLAARLAEAPPELRSRVEAARATGNVQRASDWSFDEELRALAEALLEEAKGGPPTHDTALTLLAADALITLACEWVGETEPQRLGEIG